MPSPMNLRTRGPESSSQRTSPNPEETASAYSPAPSVDTNETANSVPSEDIDDFLSSFTFTGDRVRPDNCLDPHKVIYGYSDGNAPQPSKLRFSSTSLPQIPDIHARVDVDSIIWNLQDLPVTVPIKIFPDPIYSFKITGNHQHVSCPGIIKNVAMSRAPSYLFGRIESDITIHLIFPQLRHYLSEGGQNYIPRELLRLWYEKVVYRACEECLEPDLVNYMRPTMSNAANFDPRGMIGHSMQPHEALRLSHVIRRVVDRDDFLRSRFGGYFFHVSCKGMKCRSKISLSTLADPVAMRFWIGTTVHRYAGVIQEEFRRHMMLDVGVDFIATREALEAHGPVHLLWKKEAATQITMGLPREPKVREWWLSSEVAGTTVDRGPNQVIDFSQDFPDVLYVQTYHGDKLVISGAKDHWMGRLTGGDMQWSNRRMADSWEMLMSGIEDGVRRPWHTRVEVRMSSRLFYGTDDLGGLMDVADDICRNAVDHFFSLPSLLVARYKAASLWIVREGAMAVDAQGESYIGRPERELFMNFLAGLYRGFYRGIYFCYSRTSIFGLEGITGPAWTNGRREEGVEEGTESTRSEEGTIGSILGAAELEMLFGGDAGDGTEWGIHTPISIARRIILLFKQDMIASTETFQTTRNVLEWDLEAVRGAIPRRIEKHISSRKIAKTWKELFLYLFPSRELLQDPDARELYMFPSRWTSIKYLHSFLTIQDLLFQRQARLPRGSASAFREELWARFQEVDCVVRGSLRANFAEVTGGCLRVDLRDSASER
ncbi:hypothetical protein BJ684DRAFT_15651 [Piptocephalis cylindrospora]|uniref:Uncharacterized protein n=1 Tax=Piptocephalis cylindrospora TaxID=1907219 RepID=A0A4P9Y508_9FUNG|nr:hypothetical protein BJ684DRAFT_15651 [Piptocephalis cylindrospora]|eukprot:RKP13993.1 hypothetical protein BJ684DRAFT_15651 [Piptocephalis cylindrospora]